MNNFCVRCLKLFTAANPCCCDYGTYEDKDGNVIGHDDGVCVRCDNHLRGPRFMTDGHYERVE